MWNWAIWAALGLGGLAGIAALALLVLRVRAAWHGLEELRRAVVRGLDSPAAAGRATADKVAAAGDTAEIRERLSRLRLSLARLAVLRAAIDDVQETFGRVTAVVPRK